MERNGLTLTMESCGEVNAMAIMMLSDQKVMHMLKARICPYCPFVESKGACGKNAETYCPIALHLPLIQEVLRSFSGETMRGHLRHLKTNFCAACANNKDRACPFGPAKCPLGNHLADIVDILEGLEGRA